MEKRYQVMRFGYTRHWKRKKCIGWLDIKLNFRYWYGDDSERKRYPNPFKMLHPSMVASFKDKSDTRVNVY